MKYFYPQGRSVPSEAISCPIAGEYVGVLPDAPGLCAKMSSDCNNPGTMYYTVTDCADRSHVYQEDVKVPHDKHSVGDRGKRSPNGPNRSYDPFNVYDPFNPWAVTRAPTPNLPISTSTTPSPTKPTSGYYQRDTDTTTFQKRTNYFPISQNTKKEKNQEEAESIIHLETMQITQSEMTNMQNFSPPKNSFHEPNNSFNEPDNRFHNGNNSFHQANNSLNKSNSEGNRPNNRRKTVRRVFKAKVESSSFLKPQETEESQNQSFYINKDLRILAQHPPDKYKIGEDREYECLGQWEEDNLLYTYTRRKDIPGYECFVAHVGQDGRVSLAEGGSDCKRGMRVHLFGMKLTKRRNCNGDHDSGSKWYIPPTRSPDEPRARDPSDRSRNDPYKVYREHISTRPWSPVLGRDTNRNNSQRVKSNVSIYLFLLSVILLITIN